MSDRPDLPGAWLSHPGFDPSKLRTVDEPPVGGTPVSPPRTSRPLAEPPGVEQDVPPVYGPLRDIDAALADGPTYVELVQCLHDALAAWYALIHRTHYPMLRDYEDHEVYESSTAVLESAVRHRPEMVVDPAAREAWRERLGDTQEEV